LTRVQPQRLCLQAAEPQQRICEPGRHAAQLTEQAHRKHQRIQLDRFARGHVLQCRGLEGAELAADGVAVFRLLVHGDAQALTNGLGLQHHSRHKSAHQLVAQNPVGGGVSGGTSERANGVDRHVAPELVPNVFLNLR